MLLNLFRSWFKLFQEIHATKKLEVMREFSGKKKKTSLKAEGDKEMWSLLSLIIMFFFSLLES